MPRFCAPSESSTIAPGDRLPGLAHVAGLLQRRVEHLHRGRDAVADRGPGLRLEQRDRLPERVAVGRGRDQRLRLGAERDESDLELLRAAGRGTSASRPRRRRGASARRRSPASSRRRRRAARSSRSGRAARRRKRGCASAPAANTSASASSATGMNRFQRRRRAGTRSARTCRFVKATGYFARRRSMTTAIAISSGIASRHRSSQGCAKFIRWRTSRRPAPAPGARRQRLTRAHRHLHLRSRPAWPSPGSPTAKPGGGGPLVSKAVAFQVSTSVSPDGHWMVSVFWAPAFSGTVLNTRSSGGPTGVTVAAIVFRTADGDGMQPMNGLNEPARWCAETARKRADVWVVRPNATGAPRMPSNVARMSSELPCPSVPATTPFPSRAGEREHDLAVRRHADPRPLDRDAARDAVALVRRRDAVPGTAATASGAEQARAARAPLIRAS